MLSALPTVLSSMPKRWIAAGFFRWTPTVSYRASVPRRDWRLLSPVTEDGKTQVPRDMLSVIIFRLCL